MQQALNYLKTLDSEEFSVEECSIICLPPDPGSVTEEENFNDTVLDEVDPVYLEVEINLQRPQPLDISRKKIIWIKNVMCPKEKYRILNLWSLWHKQNVGTKNMKRSFASTRNS